MHILTLHVGPENIPTEIVEDENEDIFNHTIFMLNTYIKCIVALINLLLFIAKKECIKLHHKAFRADYILRSTKIRALGAARILVLREFKYK